MKAARQARPFEDANAEVCPGIEGMSLDALLRNLRKVPLGTLVDACADRFFERLAGHLAADSSTRFATARDNPLGTERAFLDASRKGAFPSFKKGRQVAARWGDVVAYIESRQCTRKPRTRPANTNQAAPLDDEARRRAQLVAAGILPGAKR